MIHLEQAREERLRTICFASRSRTRTRATIIVDGEDNNYYVMDKFLILRAENTRRETKAS